MDAKSLEGLILKSGCPSGAKKGANQDLWMLLHSLMPIKTLTQKTFTIQLECNLSIT